MAAPRMRRPLVDWEWKQCECGELFRADRSKGPAPVFPHHWRDATKQEREDDQDLGPLYRVCEGAGAPWPGA